MRIRALAALVLFGLTSLWWSPLRAQDVEPESIRPDSTQLVGEPSVTEAPGLLAADDQAPPATDETKGSRRLPNRLGPVRIRIGKADGWIGIGSAAQLLFLYDQQLEGGGLTKSSSETLQFRRIRFALSSSFLDEKIQSLFQINLTPSSLELIDMWFSFTRHKFATFRLGQFKIPYDRYRGQSFAALSLLDWAPTARMFGSERQVGIEMSALRKDFGLEYSLGVFTGTNARASFAVGLTEAYGNVPSNPSELGSGEPFSSFHPELVGRIAKSFGQIDTDTNSDVLGTKALRQSVGVGIAWDAQPVATVDLPLRLSAEWLAKVRHVSINIVSYLAWYAPWQGGQMRFGPIGFMAETGYRFTRIWELAARYSITYLTPGLRNDARGYGQSQIIDASDPELAMMQYGQNGNQITSSQLALAGSARIIGDSLKVVAEVDWARQLWVQGSRDGIVLGLQLQLSF